MSARLQYMTDGLYLAVQNCDLPALKEYYDPEGRYSYRAADLGINLRLPGLLHEVLQNRLLQWGYSVREIKGMLETIEYLLTLGADPNATDDDGNSFLHRVVNLREPSHELIKLLLDFGANPLIKGWHFTEKGLSSWKKNNVHISTLQLAKNYNYTEIVTLFEDAIANPIFYQKGVNSLHALFNAIKKNKNGAVRKLLNNESELATEVDHATFNTPLHIAASSNNCVAITILCNRSVSPFIKNSKGETPFDLVSTQECRAELEKAAERFIWLVTLCNYLISNDRDSINIHTVKKLPIDSSELTPDDPFSKFRTDFLRERSCYQTSASSSNINITKELILLRKKYVPTLNLNQSSPEVCLVLITLFLGRYDETILLLNHGATIFYDYKVNELSPIRLIAHKKELIENELWQIENDSSMNDQKVGFLKQCLNNLNRIESFIEYEIRKNMMMLNQLARAFNQSSNIVLNRDCAVKIASLTGSSRFFKCEERLDIALKYKWAPKARDDSGFIKGTQP